MTGWAKINNVQYYFLKSGEMAKGFVEIEGKIYYFDDDDGHMATGWQDIDGKKYYFSEISLANKTEMQYNQT